MLGCIPWVLALGLIGREVGDNWEEWRDYLHYLDYVVLAAIVGRAHLPAAAAPARDRATGTDEPARPTPCRGAPASSAGRAAVLGAIQGPTELLPVSSSAHLSLVPWLAGWGWERGRSRGAQELRGRAARRHRRRAADRPAARDRAELAAFDARRAAVVALSFVPPAIVGYALERPIEERLGGPRTIAAGLAAGAVAMLLADTRPQERGPGDAGVADGLALGIAQATALVPGVSRNGATLTAARSRRFTREHANLLSRTVALPVIVGATAAQGRAAAPPRALAELGRAMASGSRASFVSTLASQRLIGLVERDRALWPYAAYRIGLAAVAARSEWAGERTPRSRRIHRAGVSQRDADRAVEALVRSLKLIDTGKPSRVVPLPGHYASVLRIDERTGVAFGTDGVGTKMLVAERLGDFTRSASTASR